jgi:hypothetical protein
MHNILHVLSQRLCEPLLSSRVTVLSLHTFFFVRALIFDVDNTKIWSSMKYCNGANDPVPVNLANPIVFDPTSCCLWGGKTVASSATTRPLERIGTCSTAKYTTGTGTESVLNLTDVYTNDQSVYGITSIPAKAFENCGSPE